MAVNQRFFISIDGTVVAYEAAPTEGDGKGRDDITANSNRPAVAPIDWLENLRFWSDAFLFEVAAGPTDVTVNHAAVSGASTVMQTFLDGAQLIRPGTRTETNHTLVTHSLGYVPLALVALNDAVLAGGAGVQAPSDQGRFVCPYVTDTIVGLRELAWSSGSALPALSRTYTVIVFNISEPDGLGRALEYDLTGGWLKMADGKLDTREKYARRVQPFESAFDFNTSPTMQFGNGGFKLVTGGNVYQTMGYFNTNQFLGPSYIPIGGVV